MKKPAEKTPAAAPAKAPAAGVVTLKELCRELKIEPREARKALREAKTKRLGKLWEWPQGSEKEGRTVLEKLKESPE